MSVQSFVDRHMQEAAAGTLNWREARKEIVERHRQATSEAERVIFIRLHKAVLDAVERRNLVDDMEAFRKIRLADYRALLMSEAASVTGKDGVIEPTVMHAITSREVAAGRMAADDELHTLSVAGARARGQSLQTGGTSKGLLSNIRSLFPGR